MTAIPEEDIATIRRLRRDRLTISVKDSSKFLKRILAPGKKDLLAPDFIELPLVCPVSQKRLTIPCRGKNCRHYGCFQYDIFGELMKIKPTRTGIICPICNLPIREREFLLDEFTLEVVSTQYSGHARFVRLFPDLSWKPKFDTERPGVGVAEIIDLTDDD